MEFKFNIDTTDMVKELQTKMTAQMKSTANARITYFFGEDRKRRKHPTKDEWVWETIKGDGLKQIDEMIENKFLDPKFQESLERYFEHNWEEMFKECMRKALQWKANGIAFNKVHKLS